MVVLSRTVFCSSFPEQGAQQVLLLSWDGKWSVKSLCPRVSPEPCAG